MNIMLDKTFCLDMTLHNSASVIRKSNIVKPSLLDPLGRVNIYPWD